MAKKGSMEKTIETLQKQIGLKGFKVSRVVTLPLWKWQDGKEKYFRIDSEIKIGRVMTTKRVDAKGKETPPMEPANIATVTNLETGEQCELIVGAVLKSTLEENYPDGGYVGKSFASTQTKIEGKRYRQYSLTEIEPEA